ncbi:MAG: hypothetical protein HOD92_21665 [Deltaproteobacteria bacterium]|jgi:hypothetical protein|nr:hypothetical protein [Deltaproteobacteria bacterium]
MQMRKVVVILLITLISACASHYDAGMKAFNEKKYSKAVSELSQVQKSHPNYSKASATLIRAEFRQAVVAVKDAKSSSEAIGNLKKMVPLALKTDSVDLYKVAFYVVLDELKDAKNAAYVKELVSSLLLLIKEKGNFEDILPLIEGLTGRLTDFLFNSEIRTTITDALKQLKALK